MRKAKIGDSIKIHIRGKSTEDEVLTTSYESDPVEVALGKTPLIPGLQEAIVGMKPEETKTVKVPPEKAFGEHREDLIRKVDKQLLPADENYEPGAIVELPQVDGKKGTAKVLDVSDSKVTLDLNHPFAGRDLIFDITLLKIN